MKNCIVGMLPTCPITLKSYFVDTVHFDDSVAAQTANQTELLARIYLLSNMAYSAESEGYLGSNLGQTNQRLCFFAVILTMKFKQEITGENCNDWMEVTKKTSFGCMAVF